MIRVIKSWASKEARLLFEGGWSRKIPADMQRRVQIKLTALHAATKLEDLASQRSNRLEKLKGDRAGQYSIRINDQYRICFTWLNGHAHAVEIVDYH